MGGDIILSSNLNGEGPLIRKFVVDVVFPWALICTIGLTNMLAAQEVPSERGNAPTAMSADRSGHVSVRTAASPKAAIDRATGMALQGDAASAARLLATQPADSFHDKDSEFRTCMVDRFGRSPSAAPFDPQIRDEWLARLTRIYIAYWQRALTNPAERDAAEHDLDAALTVLFGRTADAESIKAEVSKHGAHALLGRTPPLRELMLWQRTTEEQKQVALPEGPHSVKVIYLDDFWLRGWGHYATCGRRGTAGWATEEGLLAVVPAYKSLSDETFYVRFLAHETQHFVDKNALKGLEAWELEYRAKLVELALADQSQPEILQRFCENRSNTRDSAHAYANRQVIHDVSARIGLKNTDICETRSADPNTVRSAARDVLIQDTKNRSARRE
jgi:hypothetical protein